MSSDARGEGGGGDKSKVHQVSNRPMHLHVRRWAITAEGQMNRFLGISYIWDREKGSCKVSAAAYIERVARRFRLEDSRTNETPMEAGFEMSESDFVVEPPQRTL